MPSEADRVQRALDAVAGPRRAFRAALALTIDELRGKLDAGPGADAGPGVRGAGRLGRFADGRIDPERFATLVAEPDRTHASWTEPANRALETLQVVEARGEDAFRVSVEAGDDLYAAVDRALADAGRAFGAARVVELARTGRYVPSQHDPLLETYEIQQVEQEL